MDRFRQELDAIKIPINQIDSSILKADAKHAKEKKRKRIAFQWSFSIAAMIVLLAISLRISPTFATAMSQIPGFQTVVQMMTFDKGLKDIVVNGAIEELSISETKNDITFTLQNAVADETGMKIGYKVEGNVTPQIKRVTLQQNNVEIPASYGIPQSNESSLEIVFVKNTTFNGKNLKLIVALNDVKNTTFTIPFTLKKHIHPNKVHVVNQLATVDGQQLKIKEVIISPLRAEIKMEIPITNTKQILQIGSLKLIDENGEQWGSIQNGLVGKGSIRDGSISFYMQSNYYRKPSSLTLVIDEIEALPKGHDFVLIDFGKKQVLSQPSDLNIQLNVTSNNRISAVYPNTPNKTWQSLLGEAINAAGEKIYANQTETSGNDITLNSFYTFDQSTLTNPVKIFINSYPIYLDGKIEIPISLK